MGSKKIEKVDAGGRGLEEEEEITSMAGRRATCAVDNAARRRVRAHRRLLRADHRAEARPNARRQTRCTADVRRRAPVGPVES